MDGKSRKFRPTGIIALTAAVVSMWTFPALAQVPVDATGKPVGSSSELATDADENSTYGDAELLSSAELAELVGPVALYPDDLLAIVLPAASYPLEIVQAARFLERLEQDSSLKPSEEWDESVTALLNYPEVVRMMDKDIDWTWKLGDAFVNQQADVIAAVESFRDRAYAAGNLKSDERQTVSNEDGIIEIVPVQDDVIYVPYYEPERVVVRQARPVYYYYPRPYPVYYYPYPVGYAFYDDYFWGVTTAYQIAWSSHYLHVHHHSYWGHPYYGHSYFGHYYRRPSVHVYNSWYVNNSRYHTSNRYRDGDYWRPRRHAGDRPDYYRSTTRSYREHDVRGGRDVRTSYSSQGTRDRSQSDVRPSRNDTIQFRNRPETRAESRNESRREARPKGRDGARSESRQERPRQEQRSESRNNRPAADTRTRSNASRTANRNRDADSRIAFRDRSAETNRVVRREPAVTADARTRQAVTRPDRSTERREASVNRQPSVARVTRPVPDRRDTRTAPPAAVQSAPRRESPRQSYSEPRRMESARAEHPSQSRQQAPHARESRSSPRQSAPEARSSSARDRGPSQRSRNR
jgi:hypothetical protein